MNRKCPGARLKVNLSWRSNPGARSKSPPEDGGTVRRCPGAGCCPKHRTERGTISRTGSTFRYQCREPEQTLLHRIARENLATFLAEAADHYPSGDLPTFIAAEFERYLRCGILRCDFGRVRCASCRDEILVAFACKNRSERTFFLPIPPSPDRSASTCATCAAQAAQRFIGPACRTHETFYNADQSRCTTCAGGSGSNSNSRRSIPRIAAIL